MKRTKKQNNSLHLFCDQLAEELTDNGISLQVFIKDLSVDLTGENVKSAIRAIGKAKFGKTSTADLTTKELQACYEEINRHISQWGIHVPFPSEETRAEALESYNQYIYERTRNNNKLH